MTDQDSDGRSKDNFIVGRPQGVLNELSPEHGWEVSRRHPYYIMFWKMASLTETDEKSQYLRTAAQIILRVIGIANDPPPPSQTAEQVGFHNLPGAYKSGAIAPVQIGNLLRILMMNLAPETKRGFADFLRQSAAVDRLNSERMIPTPQDVV